MTTKAKTAPKLSPQETRVFDKLHANRPNGVPIFTLYHEARMLKGKARLAALKLSTRKLQQHMARVFIRINEKQRRFKIVPGGKAAPGTYKLTRRA